MKTPAFWQKKSAISTLLLPFSTIYKKVAQARAKNAPPPEKLPVPVICIGNVTAGGAGKTPTALAIGNWYKNRNISAYFLSRGYGGSLKGPVIVNPESHSAREVGDEPLLLARVLPTIVAKDRVQGATFACEQGAKLIIMDDGFQNHSLAKTLSLLVVDGRYGFGNGRLLPAGPLRESPDSAFARTDAVIVIGNGKPPIPAPLTLLTARITPAASAQELRGKNIVAFCGIAHPKKFFDMLALLGAHITGNAIFADHYRYRERDLQRLAARAKAADALLVTTAKDAARLSPEWKSQVTVVDIALTFDHPEQLDAVLNKL